MTPEVKQAVEELGKAFHDFRDANDRRLKALEDSGTELPELRAETDKANSAIELLKSNLDRVSQSVGRMTAGGMGAPRESADELKAARRFFAVARGKRFAANEEPDVQAYREYKTAFNAAIRGNFNLDHLGQSVRNAMSVGSDPDGGYFVPDEMSMELERRVFDTSPMRQVARVIQIGAPAWEAPYKSDDATSGGWVGEKQARAATATPQIGMQRIETHEQYAYPEVTQNMLDDAAMDVEGFILDETEDKMSRTENTAFVSGSGVMQPRGFLDYKTAAVTTDDASRAWGVLQYIPVGAAGAFPTVSGSVSHDPDALITTITKLHPVYRAGAAWAMNRATEAEVRKLKDADGRYFVGMGNVEGGLGFSLFGFPIVNLEDMPDVAADSYSIAFGNWSRGYYIIDRIGFRVLRDPYTNKPYVGFYITKRTGGDVRNFDALKLIKFAAS